MPLVLLIAAILTFLLATFGVEFGTVELVPLGLAFFAASFLPLPGGTIWQRNS
jgi:predicted Co/Zn/Cd cation transporter (cation efflux family)